MRIPFLFAAALGLAAVAAAPAEARINQREAHQQLCHELLSIRKNSGTTMAGDMAPVHEL